MSRAVKIYNIPAQTNSIDIPDDEDPVSVLSHHDQDGGAILKLVTVTKPKPVKRAARKAPAKKNA